MFPVCLYWHFQWRLKCFKWNDTVITRISNRADEHHFTIYSQLMALLVDFTSIHRLPSAEYDHCCKKYKKNRT